MKQCDATTTLTVSGNAPVEVRCDKQEHSSSEKHRIVVSAEAGHSLRINWGPGKGERYG